MKRTIILISLLIILLESPPLFSQGKKSSVFQRKGNIPAVTLNFNPMGFALYGPIIQLEFKMTNASCLVPWIRYSYAGLVSNYQWTNFESDSKYYPWSGAIGLEYKAFLPLSSRNNLLYYGGAAEFIFEGGLHNIDPQYNYEYKQIRYAIAAYGNLGYRWKSKKSFYIDMGILPGVAFDLKNKGYYTKGASEGLEKGDFKSITFIGMIDFAFGWKLVQ